MKTITVELEKILDMIVGNAGINQFNPGGNYNVVLINPLSKVNYVSRSPGTYYPKDFVVDPEDFINMDEVEKDYPLDLDEYRTTSKDVVANEAEIDIEDFEDEEWDKVTEYENEAIDEWRARARGEKKEVLQVEDAEGATIAEYKIEWI